MNRNQGILLILWLMSINIGAAQDELRTITLKIQPLAVFNPFQNAVMLHSDIPLHRSWGLDVGLGAIFDSYDKAPNKGETNRGIKARTGIKYYYNQSSDRRRYISIYYKYTYTENNHIIVLDRQGGQYRETTMNLRKINQQRLTFRVGSERFIFQNDNVFIEPFWGLGLMWSTLSDAPIPPDATILDDNYQGSLFGITPERFPDVVFGVFVGWATKKRI